jgi:hypothetical protein
MELQFKTRNLLLTLLFTAIVNYSFAYAYQPLPLLDPSGSIAIVDDDIFVDTQDSNNPVATTKIFDVNLNLVHTFSWCHSQSCRYNISQLSAGIYTIVVTTNSGYSFAITQYIQ